MADVKHNFGRNVFAGLALWLAASGVAAAQQAGESVTFDAPWIIPLSAEVKIGDGGGTATLQIDRLLLDRILLSPKDLKSLTLSVELKSDQPTSAGQVGLVRLDSQASSGSPVAAASVPAAKAGKKQIVQFAVPASVIAESGRVETLGLAVLSGSGQYTVSKTIIGRLTAVHHPAVSLFTNSLKPQPGVFARLRNGKLFYGNERLRLWGVVGYPNVGRLVNMGFNAQRVWAPYAKDMYDADSAKRGEAKPPVKGDQSAWDAANLHFAKLRDAGCFVMLASAQESIPTKWVAVDGSFVSGGDDWQQWKEAVLSDGMAKGSALVRGPLFFDERLQRIKKQHVKNLLTYVNPYTGRAYGQEEAVAVYEVFNENGGVKGILEGSYEKWPAYFQNQFRSRWNDWLRAKYQTDDKLKAAWGETKAGENLADGSIQPGPTFARRNEYSKARGNDFVQFVVEAIDAFRKDFIAHCRSLAPQGIGVNVAPFSFDTQYRPSIAWNYLESRSEVNSFGMYFWDLKSTLDRPPSASGMDSNTVDGAATIIYETNVGRPNPYRAEYPLKLAALASWQDWDGVFWHYWARGGGDVNEAYLADRLQHATVAHYWDAVHHQNDPVMCSAMAMAGRMFLENRIQPANRPAVVNVGPDGVFSYDQYNGIGLTRQTFTTGSRIRYTDANTSGPKMNGQPMPVGARVTAAVSSGDQILWDWPNGRLVVDTPTAKGYAGPLKGSYRFKDGITLGEVGSDFVSFYMISADGKPLVGPDASRKIYVAAVRNAENTGFSFDWAVKGGPVDQAKVMSSRGRAPVIVDRVPYSLWFPTQIEGRFNGIDFALRNAINQPVSGTNRFTHDGRELFAGVLEIDRRGAAMPTPESTLLATNIDTKTSEGSTVSRTGVASALWNPLPDVAWSDDYHTVHKTLRDAAYPYSSLSKLELKAGPDADITLSDAQIPTLWSLPVDVELDFRQGQMNAVTVTFKQPPPLAEVVAAYEKQFGPPVEKKFGTQFEVSTARWPATSDRPAVQVTESQGVLKILLTASTPAK